MDAGQGSSISLPTRVPAHLKYPPASRGTRGAGVWRQRSEKLGLLFSLSWRCFHLYPLLPSRSQDGHLLISSAQVSFSTLEDSNVRTLLCHFLVG